jgi:hypothetical protein
MDIEAGVPGAVVSLRAEQEFHAATERRQAARQRLSLITSKCTTCDHFKVHHSGRGFFGGWRGGWQGGNASQGSFFGRPQLTG